MAPTFSVDRFEQFWCSRVHFKAAAFNHYEGKKSGFPTLFLNDSSYLAVTAFQVFRVTKKIAYTSFFL